MVAKVSAIVAIGHDAKGRNVIGMKNELLWWIPDDLKRFKEKTSGHTIIMGQNTYDSIGHPLPNRHNVVLTLDKGFAPEGVTVASSIKDALEKAQALEKEEIFICGGASIYEQFLPHTDRLYLTVIDDQKEGDTFFPETSEFSNVVAEENHEWKGLHYTWKTLDRE